MKQLYPSLSNMATVFNFLFCKAVGFFYLWTELLNQLTLHQKWQAPPTGSRGNKVQGPTLVEIDKFYDNEDFKENTHY